MTDRHVLITGGAGYIGSLLTSELLRANYYVTVIEFAALRRRIDHPFFATSKVPLCKSRCHHPAGGQGFAQGGLAAAGLDRPSCRDRGMAGMPGRRQAGGLAVQRGGDKKRFRAGRRPGRGAIRICLHLQQLWPVLGRPAIDRKVAAASPFPVCGNEGCHARNFCSRRKTLPALP